MRWLTVVPLTVLAAFTVLGCNVPVRHYETMGCKPIGKLLSGCAERYECPSLTAHDNEKCYYNGKTYAITESIPNEEVSPFCSVLCYCRAAKPFAKFRCAHVDCPEFFQRFDYDNCFRQYQKNSCCAVGSVCGADRDKLAECELDREIYKEGQRMHFQDNPCRTCICKAGFNANATDTNPNCFETTCGFELFEEKQVYGGGIPVYKAGRCCPWEWRLPQEADKVVKGSTAVTSADPKKQCKYGKLTLNVGDTLDLQPKTDGKEKMSCTCAVPPLVHCVLE